MFEKLTTPQRDAVFDRGGNLLVSAAAGSGKTRVLTERLLSYILDKDDPANIDDFLIITFTIPAAAELRVKIADKLLEAIAENPSNQHLQRQMQRLHMAQISTVDAFCANFLREYAYKLDIRTDFKMIDSAECPELQQRILDQVMEDAYKSVDESESIRKLIESQGFDKHDNRLTEVILTIFNNSRCHRNPEKWLQWCAEAVADDSYTDVLQTEWGKSLANDLRAKMDLFIATFENCKEKALIAGVMPKNVEYFDEVIRQLHTVRNAGSWNEIRMNSAISYPKLEFEKDCVDPEFRDRLKNVLNETKAKIDKYLKDFDVENDRALSDMRSCGLATKGLVSLVVDFSRRYAKLKQQLGLMDFADLEHMTLDLLMGKDRIAPTAFAKEVGRRYREVMVDEYQDTNEVQDAIYSALTAERNNCFMVGDVKQSIYQFRLAEPGIFIDKYKRYAYAKDAKPGEDRKILLSENFRSLGGIIDCVNDVFELNMCDQVGDLQYGEDERLREGIPHDPSVEPEVELLVVDYQKTNVYEEQSAVIAKRIVELINDKFMVREKDVLREIRLEDIAILIPARTGLDQLKKALENAKIPYVVADNDGLLQCTEVMDLISLLKVINNPTQDIPLVSVLLSNVFGFAADDLARMRSLDSYSSIYQLLQKDDNEKSRNFLQLLNELRNDARIYSVTQLLEIIVHRTRFDCAFGAMKDGKSRVENIHRFLQLAASFESNGSKDLRQFIEHLDALIEYGYKDEKIKKVVSAVQITTIHKSKGLEYPVVFCMDLGKAINMQSIYGSVLCDRDLGIGMYALNQDKWIRYPTVTKLAVKRKMESDAISEQIRVLYVALTRARDKLIMTFCNSSLKRQLTKAASHRALGDRCMNAAFPVYLGWWVLLAAMGRTEAGELFAVGGNSGCARISKTPWRIKLVVPPSDPVVYTPPKDKTYESSVVTEELRDILSYEYAYQDVTRIPSKQTATQLKGRPKDSETAENAAVSGIKRYFRKPTFVSGGFAGKEYGNAYHGVMQYICYENCQTLDALNTELDRLEAALLITPEQRNMINPEKIVNFVCSPIGQRLIHADQVHREFKFSILNDAVVDGESLPEQILLQGVVDCLMVEPDGLTVVDFKSDRFKPADLPQKMEEHRPQVDAYSAAMERIFQLPVKEKILYFFSIDQAAAL